jgi:hypothetical protein
MASEHQPAGYSGTPLPKKLGIKPDARVALVHAPSGLDQALEPLPEGVQLFTRLAPQLDVIVYCVDKRASLERRFDALARALALSGGLWVAWPKKASGVPTDLTENVVGRSGSRTASSTTRSARLPTSGRGSASSGGSLIASRRGA